MRAVDHYAVLGVAADADRARIRAAYLRTMRASHPDLRPGDAAGEELARAANAAWEVLRSPGRREAYDRRRAAASRARGGEAVVDAAGGTLRVPVAGRGAAAREAAVARAAAHAVRHRRIAERFHRASLRVGLAVFGAGTLLLLLVAAR